MLNETEGAQSDAPEPNDEPATDAGQSPPPPPPPEQTSAPPEEPEKKLDEPKKDPWFVKQINQQHARIAAQARELAEREERIKLLEAAQEAARQPQEPAQQSGQQPPTQPAPRQLSQADIDRMIDERAALKARDAEFNAACNSTYEKGKQELPDFDAAVQGVGMLTGNSPPREFLEAVTALPNSHEVYYHLGKNLDEAARILTLPPVRMALELARLSGQVAPKPKATSKAPAPITPVAGAGSAHGDDDISNPKLSWERFCELRDKEERRARSRV